MIVTADEVNRSFRGTLDLLNSRAEGLKSFDMSERGFWRSFTALWLTLPAYVVSLAFERLRPRPSPARPLPARQCLGRHRRRFRSRGRLRRVAGGDDLDRAVVSAGEGLCALRHRDELDLGDRHAGALGARHALLVGWAPPGLASLFSLAFAIIVVRLQWFATKSTLGLASLPALGIVVFGILLNAVVASAMRGLLG